MGGGDRAADVGRPALHGAVVGQRLGAGGAPVGEGGCRGLLGPGDGGLTVGGGTGWGQVLNR